MVFLPLSAPSPVAAHSFLPCWVVPHLILILVVIFRSPFVGCIIPIHMELEPVQIQNPA